MSANDPERTSFHASAVREAFSWVDVMMHSAQSRRITLIREITIRRELEKRFGKA
jgi:hypothetical protein